MKRTAAIIPALALIMLMGACGAKAPESISLKSEGYLLTENESRSVTDDLEIEGDGDYEFNFSVADSSVAEISEDGVITALKEGSTTVTVTSAADESISATADVLVYDYTGVYTGEKYIDAMGCNIRISFALNADGTYSFFRYPMYVALSGGGRMEGMSVSGSYSISGSTISVSSEDLGDFSLSFMLSDGSGQLSGEMPTGGASTTMQLDKAVYEDSGESGTYTGAGETEDGGEISYTLSLESGSYTLTAAGESGEEVVSAGEYYFTDDTTIEFFASGGVTFNASYDASRGVVEGTEIPVSAESSYEEIAVTLSAE